MPRKVFSAGSIVIGAIFFLLAAVAVLGWLVELVVNPDWLSGWMKNTTKVVTTVFDGLGLMFIFRRLKQVFKARFEQAPLSFSGILHTLGKSPGMCLLILLLFVFTWVMMSHTLPFYRLAVTVHPETDTITGVRPTVTVKSGDKEYALNRTSDTGWVYHSDQAFTWGQDGEVVVTRGNHEIVATRALSWPGVMSLWAYVNRFDNMSVDMESRFVRVGIRLDPPVNDALIEVEPSVEMVIQGSGVFSIPKMTPFTISITHPNYAILEASWEGRETDTQLSYSLSVPVINGMVRFNPVRRVNQAPLNDMIVTIRGQSATYMSGELISLAPGTYTCDLSKDIPGEGVWKATGVRVTVVAGETREVTCEADFHAQN